MPLSRSDGSADNNDNHPLKDVTSKQGASHLRTDPATVVGAQGAGGTERVRASPRARRLARVAGIDLSTVKGTGPSGRIVAADTVETANGQQGTRDIAARRRAAAELSRSQIEIPAFAAARWIDMEQVLSGVAAAGNRRTATDGFLFAIATAMAQIPEFRQVWNPADQISEELETINVGIVVSTPRGLVIPVLKGLDGVSIDEITIRRRAAVSDARAGRLSQACVGRTSVSLSSLLRDDADEFEAIISPGQTAMVAVGRVAPKVVAVGGEIVIRQGCTVTVTADHRVVDGVGCARFIGMLARTLEAGRW